MTLQAERERDQVRRLAREVAEIAAGDENGRIFQRWRDVNALRRGDRAPVWCRPVGCWAELLPEDYLTCDDKYLRGIERGFRRILIKHEIGDDTPVSQCFDVSAAFDVDPANRWGVDIRRHEAPTAGGAWLFDPPLKTVADFDKLRIATWTYNEERTQRNLARAEELLGDILPVGLTCDPHGAGSATICSPAASLRGLTEMMMDTIAEPKLLHRLMAFLRDWLLSAMEQVAATGLMTRNNTGPMTCSDPFGPESEDGKLTHKNMWCHGNSQEFDQISPEMWKEFLLEYQMPIFKKFGYVHYGCCENLTHKIDDVLSIPNLRIFTCSAWTDLDVVLDRCGEKYVIMWRQKASDVVFPDDIATLRSDLEDGMRRLQGRYYQVVLRELQTLAGHPRRLHEWTALAKEAAAKYA